ncbi:winged helix-turn-helix transcriptional regulator [Micromonospora sonchi]|uniref:winged helix-turn-helix transcriptional regulator n=1 Tax=Micromonospora sonchi TaxID=1763543 RepID=UPI003570A890
MTATASPRSDGAAPSEHGHDVPGISDPQLTLRLKQLQERGLIARTVVPSTPVQITYALTADGRELIAALQPLAD